MKVADVARSISPSIASAMLALLLLATGCGNPDDKAAAGLGAEPAKLGPEVVGSEYRAIALDADPSHGAMNTQVAVTTEAVLFYGGLTPAADDSAGGLVPRGDGSLLDLRTEELVDILPWPHPSPPFEPGVAAVDNVFIVVGTPCVGVEPTDTLPDCHGSAQAAVFDPSTASWEKVPAPSEQLDLDADMFASVVALGAVDGLAYFAYQVGNEAGGSIVGFDRSSSSWRDFGPFISTEADHCVTSSGLLRGFVSPEGGLTAERLDVDSGEWRRTADGRASQLQVPDDLSVKERETSDGPNPPRLLCVGDQLIALVTGAGAPEAMYWFSDEAAEWYETPVPKLQTGDVPSAAFLDGVLVLWPNAGLGDPQALSVGTWTALDGAPPLRLPKVVRGDDELVVVGQEPKDDGTRGPFSVGRLLVHVE